MVLFIAYPTPKYISTTVIKILFTLGRTIHRRTCRRPVWHPSIVVELVPEELVLEELILNRLVPEEFLLVDLILDDGVCDRSVIDCSVVQQKTHDSGCGSVVVVQRQLQRRVTLFVAEIDVGVVALLQQEAHQLRRVVRLQFGDRVKRRSAPHVPRSHATSSLCQLSYSLVAFFSLFKRNFQSKLTFTISESDGKQLFLL